MEVRAGRIPGVPAAHDPLALVDVAAATDEQFRAVAVGVGEAVASSEDHAFAAASPLRGRFDATGGNGHDARSRIEREVESRVIVMRLLEVSLRHKPGRDGDGVTQVARTFLVVRELVFLPVLLLGIGTRLGRIGRGRIARLGGTYVDRYRPGSGLESLRLGLASEDAFR
jgi:hypothetical protein